MCVHAVSVTWNGTSLTGPPLVHLPNGDSELLTNQLASALIYHDELPVFTGSDTLGDPNGPGALVCRSEAQAGWYFPNGNPVEDFEVSSTAHFQQIRTGNETPSLSRLVRRSDVSVTSISSASGYWFCYVNEYSFMEVRVGIYGRGI